MPAEVKPITVKGFSRLNTVSVSSHQEDNEIRVLENMIWEGDNTVRIRDGTQLYKTNAQWGSNPVREAADIDFGTGAYELYSLNNGKLYYNQVSAYTDSTTTFTEINGVTGTSPALNNTTTAKVFFNVLNDKCFITDETQNSYYVDNSLNLKLNKDPEGFSFELTVGAATAASVNATYTDDDDSTRIFTITEDKTGGTGTTLTLRQTAGSTRPTTGGTDSLTKTSGTGDASISYTAINYPENFISSFIHEGRLFLISDLGFIYYSEINNGLDLDGAGSSFVQYGLEDSLKVSNAVNFKRTTILTAENSNLRRSSLGTILGYRKPSSSADTRDGLIRLRREAKNLGIIGRSAQEVGNSFIGLTRAGFISAGGLDSNEEFGLNDISFLSKDIHSLINKIDWSESDKIVSTVDLENQRYWCAVPFNTTNFNTTVFVYDFRHSTPADRNREASHKWSVYSFNYGGDEIVSLFTLRNKPYLGLSDGTIMEGEIENYYLDNNESYVTRFESKSFDFDARHAFKRFQDLWIDFTIKEELSLDIIAVTDEQNLSRDYKNAIWSNITLTPRRLQGLTWGEKLLTKWGNSLFESWDKQTAEELTIKRHEGLKKGIQTSIKISDTTGGKYWGVSGLTITAAPWSKVSDQRP